MLRRASVRSARLHTRAQPAPRCAIRYSVVVDSITAALALELALWLALSALHCAEATGTRRRSALRLLWARARFALRSVQRPGYVLAACAVALVVMHPSVTWRVFLPCGYWSLLTIGAWTMAFREATRLIAIVPGVRAETRRLKSVVVAVLPYVALQLCWIHCFASIGILAWGALPNEALRGTDFHARGYADVFNFQNYGSAFMLLFQVRPLRTGTRAARADVQWHGPVAGGQRGACVRARTLRRRTRAAGMRAGACGAADRSCSLPSCALTQVLCENNWNVTAEAYVRASCRHWLGAWVYFVLFLYLHAMLLLNVLTGAMIKLYSYMREQDDLERMSACACKAKKVELDAELGHAREHGAAGAPPGWHGSRPRTSRAATACQPASARPMSGSAGSPSAQPDPPHGGVRRAKRSRAAAPEAQRRSSSTRTALLKSESAISFDLDSVEAHRAMHAASVIHCQEVLSPGHRPHAPGLPPSAPSPPSQDRLRPCRA